MVQEQIERQRYVGRIMAMVDNNNGFVKFNVPPIKAKVYCGWLGGYKDIELLSVMNIGKVIYGGDGCQRADVCECYAMSDDGTIWGLYDHFDIPTLEKILKAVCGESALLDKLLDMSCPTFTEFMRSIGKFGENDYVAEYSPREVGEMVAIGNELGCSVELDIEVGHDYFIYGRKDGDTYKIIGLLDDSEDWIGTFKLEDIVRDYPEKIKYW
jgi:hypothetical protein